MALRPASASRRFSGGMATMVVQLGLATMPLGIDSSACGLTSDTTSGTSGSRRQAEELSITTAPWEAARSAKARLVVAPAENRQTSSPE